MDFIIRQSQDGQTAGIPVGPDTSRLISELILSKIDFDHLQTDRKKVHYVRHVDDYWIGGDSIDKCENYLRKLRIGLGEYQLDINESKTKIVPLSQAIGESWPTELKKEISETFERSIFRSNIPSQDVTSLLCKIIDRAVLSHDDGIIKFSLRQIDRSRSWNNRWDILEPFLAHCAIQFPHSFDYVARVIAWRARRGEPYDIALWKEVTLSVASTASSLGHDSELSWSLWLMKELGIKVGSRLSDKFISTSDPLVMSMLSHMVVHGLIGKTSFLNDLQDIALGDEQFSGRYWPLTLELYHLGHNGRLEAHRSANNEPLSSYHANRATIIDWSRLPRAFDREEGDDGSGHWEPDFAIEDYASAYDGEDEEDLDSDIQFPDEDMGFLL